MHRSLIPRGFGREAEANSKRADCFARFLSPFFLSLSLSLSADFHGSLTHRKIYSNDTRYGVIVRGRLDVFGESMESRLSIFDWN